MLKGIFEVGRYPITVEVTRAHAPPATARPRPGYSAREKRPLSRARFPPPTPLDTPPPRPYIRYFSSQRNQTPVAQFDKTSGYEGQSPLRNRTPHIRRA